MEHKKTSEFTRWLVVMTASLLFFYNFIQLNMLNSITPELMKDFSIDAAQFGTLSAIYFYANFLVLFPAGLILDRFSTRKIILFAMILHTISMFVFAGAHHLFYIGLSRFFSGFGGAFAFLACIRLATRWFPPKKMAFVTGCVVTMAMIGGVVAQTPMAVLSGYIGWRNAMTVIGLIGIVIMVLMYFVLRDHPVEYKEEKPTEENDITKLGFWKSVRIVLLNPYNWLGGLYTSLMNLPIFLLGALWGSMYLVQADRLTVVQASYVIAMIFLGTIFGSPLVGWISDKIRRRVFPMVIGAILSLGIILIIIYFKDLSLGYLMLLFFLLGLITSTQVLSYPTIVELNSPLVSGSALSVISLLIMASGFIAQPFFGWLMDLHWKHVYFHKMAIYSLQDFHLAMSIMPIAFIISLVVAFLIKETHGKAQVK